MPTKNGLIFQLAALALASLGVACSGGDGTLFNDQDRGGGGLDGDVGGVSALQVLAEPGLGTEVTIRARPLGVLNQPLDNVPVLFELAEGAPDGVSLRVTQPVSFGDTGALARLTFNEGVTSSAPITVSIFGREDEPGLSRTIIVASPVVQDEGEPPSANIRLVSSANTLPSDADLPGEGVTLTSIVTDLQNNLVSGATVIYSSCELGDDGNCLDQPTVVGGAGALQVTQAVTDASGVSRAVATTGGDIRNRRIRVFASPRSNPQAQASFDLVITGTSLSLNGPQRLANSSRARYTATLRDAGGFGIAGQTVGFFNAATSLDADDNLGLLESCASSGTPVQTLQTDANGEANYELVEPAADLVVLACALDDQVAAAVPVDVAETGLVLSYTDGSISERDIDFGECIPVDLQFAAADTSAIANQDLRLGITRGTIYSDGACTNPVTEAVTDENGAAQVFIASGGANGAGVATLTAEHDSGASAQINAEFVAIVPSRVDVVAEPATVEPGGSATIRAVVRDPDNNFVKNQIVRFNLEDSSGGVLSAPTAVTDSQGRAQISYTASSVASEKDSVIITASIDGQPQVPNDTATLTVGGNALRISLGTGNTIFEPTQTVYDYPFVAIVTDALGNPAPPETQFRLSIEVLQFQKGVYEYNGTVWVKIVSATCPNEDIDRDGILDPGEDVNGDGILTPGNVVSLPATADLDDRGIGEFVITYAQENANWIQVRLRAIASVTGSEFAETQVFFLEGLADDFNRADIDPPGNPSPYGVSNVCTDAE